MDAMLLNFIVWPIQELFQFASCIYKNRAQQETCLH